MGMQKTIRMNVSMGKDLWPHQVVDEIQKVMEEGEADGKRDWDKLFPSQHILYAREHIQAYVNYDTSEDHLAHAFARLMMAIAIERGYVKPVVKDEEDTDA